MRTLRTLQQMVMAAPPKGTMRPLTQLALHNSGASIIEAKATNDRSLLLVYDNGYVEYDNGLRHTVFPLHDIHGDYCYCPYSGIKTPDMFISEEEILSMPWYLGTLLVAEDRIVHNQNNSTVNRNVYPVGLVPEEMFGLIDPEADPLDQIIRHQELLDVIRIVGQALSTITDDQRKVVIEVFSNDEKRKDIARKLKMSPQLLNYFLQTGMKGMRRAIDLDDEYIRSLIK